MKPELMPRSPGDPCWRLATVEAQLSPIAQLSNARTDWFLATHSPIRCRTASNDELSEAELFQKLFHSAAPEQLVVIKGSPGAGKSQLINWLRLRFEDALSRGEVRDANSGNLRTVLIRRRSGSLKDALEQLVDQLPEYERFLADVKTAIAEISSEQARRKLSFEISTVLYGRQQRGELPNDLQYLFQLFQDLRSLEWMCRPGGAIDRNIQRLTNESDVQTRESLPEFTADEFDFRRVRRGRDVDTLMLDMLEEEDSLRVQAADIVNTVLREALANVTGIKGQTLHEIFRNIRRAMFDAGEDLALFVEDVSTMSILDEELVNALEPQGDSGLCRMLSVLGMTLPAYNRLQENKKERIALALEIQGDLGHLGPLADAEQADRFVARYLNALRVGEGELPMLAEDRRLHDEVRHSACDGCDLQESCFESFGSVNLGDVQIGLYPLSNGATFRLLEGLDAPDSSRNPRGLLQRVVRPLLDTFGSATLRRSSSMGIDLKPFPPTDLAQLNEVMLGGWDHSERSRLSYLTWYWTGARELSVGALKLAPMLPWLGLPRFSGKVRNRQQENDSQTASTGQDSTHPATGGGSPPLKPPIAPPPPGPGVTTIPVPLEKARQHLQSWFDQGKNLESDADFRELLLKVVKTSLYEEGVRTPSFAMRQRSSVKVSNIVIDGMVSKIGAASKVRFRFARDESTYSLLFALLDYKYLGRESWEFDGSVSHQRIYSRWIARHRKTMLDAYHVVECPPDDAQNFAAAFLVMAYRFCKRTALPSDTASATSLLTSFEATEPCVISPLAQRIAADARDRVQKIKGFLLAELNVPQGETGSVNFIDPRCIIKAVGQQRFATRLPEFTDPAAETDYPEVYRLCQSVWRDLPAALDAEHAAITAMLEELRSTAHRWAIDADESEEGGDELMQAMRIFLQSARAVLKACNGAGHSIGNPELEGRILELAPAKVNAWINCVPLAREVQAAESEAVLSFDMASLLKLSGFVKDIDLVMRKLAEDMENRMADVVTQEDVETERSRAQGAVHAMLALVTRTPTTTQQEGQSVDPVQ
ncbi:hypothetical protein P5W98_00670 [Paraburkholderia sp. A1BS-2L]|uniref:hypothetical protein n=1 Tax=Paraburkholderia sp. A1BS-2L TaxID=3028373 RepID=UPI003DA84739